MKLYILGIAGTFMAGCALIARQLGMQVTGCDKNVYPPMSEQLEGAKINYHQGFDVAHAQAADADCYIIGNAISRGNPVLEWILDDNKLYTSAPAWLYEHCLRNKHVIAISGTHGKTTSTALLLHILIACGYNPSYLIGGALGSGKPSAQLTDSPYFVIEADEYDTAFFDKRAKFIHYHPNTLVINSLEFDHADIFAHYADVERTFHHLIRTLPRTASIIHHNHQRVKKLLTLECYSQQKICGPSEDAYLRLLKSTTNMQAQTQTFSVQYTTKQGHKEQAKCSVPLLGKHNRENTLAALAAALDVGVPLTEASASLAHFAGGKKTTRSVLILSRRYFY